MLCRAKFLSRVGFDFEAGCSESNHRPLSLPTTFFSPMGVECWWIGHRQGLRTGLDATRCWTSSGHPVRSLDKSRRWICLSKEKGSILQPMSNRHLFSSPIAISSHLGIEASGANTASPHRRTPRVSRADHVSSRERSLSLKKPRISTNESH